MTVVLVAWGSAFVSSWMSDGRLSGRSGAWSAAIHVTPEGGVGDPLACVRDGDVIRVDAESGTLEVLVDDA